MPNTQKSTIQVEDYEVTFPVIVGHDKFVVITNTKDDEEHLKFPQEYLPKLIRALRMFKDE